MTQRVHKYMNEKLKDYMLNNDFMIQKVYKHINEKSSD